MTPARGDPVKILYQDLSRKTRMLGLSDGETFSTGNLRFRHNTASLRTDGQTDTNVTANATLKT